MKIREDLAHDGIGHRYVLRQTYDADPVLDSVKKFREVQETQRGDFRHVARIPAWLPKYLCSVHGIDYTDVTARKELLYRLLMNGELSKFRIDEGRHDMRIENG